jgi:hypothetical protein
MRTSLSVLLLVHSSKPHYQQQVHAGIRKESQGSNSAQLYYGTGYLRAYYLRG